MLEMKNTKMKNMFSRIIKMLHQAEERIKDLYVFPIATIPNYCKLSGLK